jgi:2-polyprenyl-3-methyl-5-hydroxy-6-metoxy-1,4-benzoquinol methylase
MGVDQLAGAVSVATSPSQMHSGHVAVGEGRITTGLAPKRHRRAQVLETLADILTLAATAGRRFAVVDDGSGHAGGFADDLAETLRFGGATCTRLSGDCGQSTATGSAYHADGLVLADGPQWRLTPPGGAWDITIFLRTPPAHGTLTRHGDGERDADILIDYHDPQWPVIRHVSPALEHSADRLYLSETRAFFATRAFTWNEKFGDDLPAYEQAVAESDVPAGATIVDVGCGIGRALPALCVAAGDEGMVIGIDVTPEMLTVASVQFAGQSRLLLADARHLPLPTSSVDAVFAAGLIQHLPEPTAGLTELARITRPGGRLIVFHPSGRAALAAAGHCATTSLSRTSSSAAFLSKVAGISSATTIHRTGSTRSLIACKSEHHKSAATYKTGDSPREVGLPPV